MYKAPVRNHLVSLGACVFLFLDLIPESTFSYSLAIFFFFYSIVLVLNALLFGLGHVFIYSFMHFSLFFIIHTYLSLLT